MAPDKKRGCILKNPNELAHLPEPSGSVPAVIRRLKLPALPVGSLFDWYHDHLDKQRCQMAESRRRSADRRQRVAATMRRYRAKLRAARPDLKAIWRKRS